MTTEVQNNPPLAPIRACIFDVDGLLINSEDIYTEIYNSVLHSYGKPDLPWAIKAQQQSKGSEGALSVLRWANLSIGLDEWNSRVHEEYDRFKACTLLPGVEELLCNLANFTTPKVYLAVASSASRSAFQTKTSHLPALSGIPGDNHVFGDDHMMKAAAKKPSPKIYFLALAKINENLHGETIVTPKECLVFEDSVAGVEAGRSAGMRVIWVPHAGLRKVCTGREEAVLTGKTQDLVWENIAEEGGAEGCLRSKDGWAEMLMSLEDFDYKQYSIELHHDEDTA